jgi:DNA-binding response OmpR family regulator
MILAVDDDPDILFTVEAILEKEGFEVETANGGTEALELLKTRTPELILLDVMMPDIDGWGVLREIRSDERLKRLPVVMLTVKSIKSYTVKKSDVSDVINYLVKPFTKEKMNQDEFIDRGAKFFWINKPFTRETLVKKIKTILEEKIPD